MSLSHHLLYTSFPARIYSLSRDQESREGEGGGERGIVYVRDEGENDREEGREGEK